MNKMILEKRANDFRRVCGYGLSDPISMRGLLVKQNVVTVFKPLSENFGGLSIKVSHGEEVKRFMLVNNTRTIGHQNFTIAHECYHLFIQEGFSFCISKSESFQSKHGEEYQADQFAAFLLLPESGIMSMIPDHELGKNQISLSTILKIEHYFSSSRLALLYRLKQLGIIDTYRFEDFSRNIKRSALEHGYPLDLYESGNSDVVLGDYGTLARELFDKEMISETHYYLLLMDLGMNVDQIDVLKKEKKLTYKLI